jgi:hypothetical protein
LFVLINKQPIEVPEGYAVVMDGPTREGDKAYDDSDNVWSDADYEEDVQNCLAVIRPYVPVRTAPYCSFCRKEEAFTEFNRKPICRTCFVDGKGY